jgi:hypothetical protein
MTALRFTPLRFLPVHETIPRTLNCNVHHRGITAVHIMAITRVAKAAIKKKKPPPAGDARAIREVPTKEIRTPTAKRMKNTRTGGRGSRNLGKIPGFLENEEVPGGTVGS